MKRLIILSLVLAMASTADAADLELSVDGSRDGSGNTTHTFIWNFGGTITIDVYCNTYAPAGDEFWLGIEEYTGGGDWVDGTDTVYTPPAPMATFTAYNDNWWHFDPGGIITNPGYIGKWCEVDFMGLDIGDIYIYLTDHTGYVIEDTILVHRIVPEPMTILLLGLGGLFLHRRKK